MVSPIHSRVERLSTADGLDLAVETCDPAGGPALLFAHGFGQTRAPGTATAAALAGGGCRCVSSTAAATARATACPAATITWSSSPTTCCGWPRAAASRRSWSAPRWAACSGLVLPVRARPAPFRALVLVDITPRWETAGVERILAFMQAHPDGFADYAEAAEQIAAYLPQRRERKSEEQLRPLLREGADGRLRWHWDPALLAGVVQRKRALPAASAWRPRRNVDVPVLLLSGARSDVVSRDTVDEFLQLVPHARHVELPEATHMVAGDANDAFTREIAASSQTLDSLPTTGSAPAPCTTVQ